MAVVRGGACGFAIVNFANPDMVGHTGNWEATVRACEAVDSALGRIVAAASARNGSLVAVTGDHGNAETMRTALGEPAEPLVDALWGASAVLSPFPETTYGGLRPWHLPEIQRAVREFDQS